MFDLYLNELIEWNKKFNLTAITEPEKIRLKHFADSLALLDVIKLTNESVIDVGAGAGFPGLPLKIACPGIKLTLLEATGKKVEFLKHIISRLNLTDVTIIKGRAEETVQEYREKFALAVARAVAKLNILAEYCLPFVKVGGLFIAYKEWPVDEEVAGAQKAVKILGGKVRDIKKIELLNSNLARSLVIVEKISPTPPQYPRRTGTAKKRPLR
ncbi:16S rRNA (guanine(527)-N(7))-methyltransferase RsmG [Candidatus Saganbacteria bacterium]|nr:16S rRNA (guanine(527)-N(7))-methyltransferase RsmG [Candidatus Saganbacteria bacterium]